MKIVWREAANGAPVPGVFEGGRFKAFHSMREPGKEAQRVEQSSGKCDFLTIIGGAALHHLPEYKTERLIMLIIPDREIFLAEQNRRLRDSLKGRDDLLILLKEEGEDNFAARIAHEFAARYYPLFHGKLFIYTHRSLALLYADELAEIAAAVRNCADRELTDFVIQKRFGKLWMYQICKNSTCARPAQPPAEQAVGGEWEKLRAQWRGGPVIIAGAGPGLEEGMEKIRHQKNHLLIAADTALPCLLDNSICPHWVLSTDPQYYSLLHYLSRRSARTVLFYDIGIPAAIPRLFARKIPLASPHPLNQWLLKHGADMLLPPFHGSNAGTAALGLALAAGPSSITTYGIDFRNSGGRRYSRGTCQHHWACAHAGRLAPAETYHYELASRAGRAERGSDGVEYVSREYESYRREFESFAGRWGTLERHEAGYSIIPGTAAIFQLKEEHAVKIQPWPDFIQRITEITTDDISRFIQRFYSAGKSAMTEADIVLLAFMPFFAHYHDYAGALKERFFLELLQFARKKISHIMAS